MKINQLLTFLTGRSTEAKEGRPVKDAKQAAQLESSHQSKVAAYIAEGKIQEVFEFLISAGSTDAALLKAQWDVLQERQTEPNVDWESLVVAQNRIRYALLEMSKPPEARDVQSAPKLVQNAPKYADKAQIPVALSEVQREQLNTLLKQSDQWQLVLEKVKDWSVDLALLHSRYQNLERHFHLGLMTEDTYHSSCKQILEALRFYAVGQSDG